MLGKIRLANQMRALILAHFFACYRFEEFGKLLQVILSG